jgi:phosphoribosylamine--glycine ligase
VPLCGWAVGVAYGWRNPAPVTPARRALSTLAAVKVLIVGSGGREHALAWKLRQSPVLDELHAAPGNPGIAMLGACHPVRAEDAEGLLGLAHALEVDLVVVGPEAPLVGGAADLLRRGGVGVFGPSAAAARIEGSKSFAKDVMRAARVPTAGQLSVARPPCVVKADGLAAGKGVFVCRTQAELDSSLHAAAALGGPLVIEELLEGEEVSVLAVCDGQNALALPAARDFKRAEDGDAGPNTGGMGSYAPVPELGPTEVEELLASIHLPVIQELAARGSPFVGTLFAGLMLTSQGPKVLEFNCRFGDPETESQLPLLAGDLLPALRAAAAGDLSGAELPATGEAAVTVVLVAEGYPASGDTGGWIVGAEEAEATGALVFHAGTALREGRLVTNGGRILGVTGVGETIAEARNVAYDAARLVSFPGVRYRNDVALAAAERGRVRG